MRYDVVVVGGGPSGLSAALALGRARRRLLVCDSGPRRNAAARRMHNFVTRDGMPPDEFRRIAREQLAAYPNVEVADARVEAVAGARGAFDVRLSSGAVASRRLLLATGLIDEIIPLDGCRDLWGHSIYQCPYCHGWEMRDRRWGLLVLPTSAAHWFPFAMQLRCWTDDLVVFTNGVVEPADAAREQLHAAGIRIETAPVARLAGRGGQLEAVVLSSGASVRRDVLFAHPRQHQVELVRALGLALDPDGYVQVDPMRYETSVPGIYASGDLTTRSQAAVVAAASGMQAAAAINVDLATDLGPSQAR